MSNNTNTPAQNQGPSSVPGLPSGLEGKNLFTLYAWLEVQNTGLAPSMQKNQESILNTWMRAEIVRVNREAEKLWQLYSQDLELKKIFNKYADALSESYVTFLQGRQFNKPEFCPKGMTQIEHDLCHTFFMYESNSEKLKTDNFLLPLEIQLKNQVSLLLYHRYVYDWCMRSQQASIKSIDDKRIAALQAQIGGSHTSTSPSTLSNIGSQDQLPGYLDFCSKDEYMGLFSRAIDTLRQKNNDSGLIEVQNGLPTIIIGDIHARYQELTGVMYTQITSLGGKSILKLLEEGKINVVLVGDYFHTESMLNWKAMKYRSCNDQVVFDANGEPVLTEYGTILKEIQAQEGCGPQDVRQIIQTRYPHQEKRLKDIEQGILETEMKRNFYMMRYLLNLSNKFPNFYMCRGNHDDISDHEGVSKFANEGAQMKQFASNKFGDDFVQRWSEVEKQFALCAVFDGKRPLVVSHTMGKAPLTRQQIQKQDSLAIHTLNWSNYTNGHDIPKITLRTHMEATVLGLGLTPSQTRVVLGHRSSTDGTPSQEWFGESGQITMAQLNDQSKLPFALYNTNTGEYRAWFHK